jgi:gluconolactonase
MSGTTGARLSRPAPVPALLARAGTLLEGPRITAAGDLLFSDVIAGGVYKHTRDGVVHMLVPGRRGVGGLVEHRDGGVVVTGKDLIHVDERGGSRQLLAREGVHGFNDLTTLPGGQLLVGGLRYRPLAGERAVPGELLLVDAPGSASVISETLLWPNGVGLAPDAARVYVSDYAREHVKVISLDGGREDVFCDSPEGSADGLAVDVEGGVWVALGSGGGVARFEPDGRLDVVVDVPAQFVSSISFGGADRRDVVISTADNTISPDTGGTLFTARSEVAGLVVERAGI